MTTQNPASQQNNTTGGGSGTTWYHTQTPEQLKSYLQTHPNASVNIPVYGAPDSQHPATTPHQNTSNEPFHIWMHYVKLVEQRYHHEDALLMEAYEWLLLGVPVSTDSQPQTHTTSTSPKIKDENVKEEEEEGQQETTDSTPAKDVKTESNDNLSQREKTQHPLLHTVHNALRLKGTGYPLLYGYWIKWAQLALKHLSPKESNQIYELALQYNSGCLELWLSYCLQVMEVTPSEESTHVRNIFERAVQHVGSLYHSNLIWEKYIEFEQQQDEMIRVTNLYRRLLQVALQVTHLDEMWNRFDAHLKAVSVTELTTNTDERNTLQDLTSDDDKKNAFRSWIEPLYQSARDTAEKIQYFEDRIKRSYFHPKPLDDDDVDNWRRYVEYREQLQDNAATKQLYQQALIACASTAEFSKRFANFLVEHEKDVESARAVMKQATQFYAPGSRPQSWIALAEFEEAQRESVMEDEGAAQTFLNGNVYSVFEAALSAVTVYPVVTAKTSPEEKVTSQNQKPSLPIHYSIAQGHLETASKYLITAFRNDDFDKVKFVYETYKQEIMHLGGHFGATYGKLVKHMQGEEKAYNVLNDNMKEHPNCKFACINLIEFEIDRRIRIGESKPASEQVDYICSLFEQSFSNTEMPYMDREFLYKRYMFFVRMYGTITRIQQAERMWYPHQCDSIVSKTKQSLLKRVREEQQAASSVPQNGTGDEPEKKRMRMNE